MNIMQTILEEHKDDDHLKGLSCWEWTGYRLPGGYGQTSYKGHRQLAHRAMYMYIQGIDSIPKGNVVMHTCDNPSCVNPEHLVLGTQQQNIDDMHQKGRWNKPNVDITKLSFKKGHTLSKGMNHGNSKLHIEEVMCIKRLRGRYLFTYVKLAKIFDVSRQTIESICNNKGWI